jgi:hypothetical protein
MDAYATIAHWERNAMKVDDAIAGILQQEGASSTSSATRGSP